MGHPTYYCDAMADSLRMAAPKLGRCEDLTPEQMERSAHWRPEEYCYSVLNELYLHASLWERHGIRLRYHPFSDVRLFVDGGLKTALCCACSCVTA